MTINPCICNCAFNALGKSFFICWITFHFQKFQVRRSEKKIKIELEPKMYKISGTSGVIYINDIYSKKEANYPKKSFNDQLFQFK